MSDNKAGRIMIERLREEVLKLKIITTDRSNNVSFIDPDKRHCWQVEIMQ